RTAGSKEVESSRSSEDLVAMGRWTATSGAAEQIKVINRGGVPNGSCCGRTDPPVGATGCGSRTGSPTRPGSGFLTLPRGLQPFPLVSRSGVSGSPQAPDSAAKVLGRVYEEEEILPICRAA